MSSLRLALKQSLAEAASHPEASKSYLSSGSKRGRPKQDSGTSSSNINNNNNNNNNKVLKTKHKGEGGTHNMVGHSPSSADSSTAVSASAMSPIKKRRRDDAVAAELLFEEQQEEEEEEEEQEEEEQEDVEEQQEEEEQEEEHDLDENENESQYSVSSKTQQQQKQQQQQQQQQYAAAKTIQDQWKKNRSDSQPSLVAPTLVGSQDYNKLPATLLQQQQQYQTKVVDSDMYDTNTTVVDAHREENRLTIIIPEQKVIIPTPEKLITPPFSSFVDVEDFPTQHGNHDITYSSYHSTTTDPIYRPFVPHETLEDTTTNNNMNSPILHDMTETTQGTIQDLESSNTPSQTDTIAHPNENTLKEENVVLDSNVIITDKTETVTKKKRQRKKKNYKDPIPTTSNSTSSSINNNIDTEDLWVACDLCKKWRKLPASLNDKLPELWYCEYNTYDLERNHCEAPEETYDEVKKSTKKKSMNHTTLANTNTTTTTTTTTSSSSSNKKEKQEEGVDEEEETTMTTTTQQKNIISYDHPLPKSFYLNKTGASNTSIDTTTIGPNRSFASLDGAAAAAATTTTTTTAVGGAYSDSGESLTPVPPTSKHKGTSKPGRKPSTTNTNAQSLTSNSHFRTSVKEEEKKKNTRTGTDIGGALGGVKKPKETTSQQEWVQCESCEKWRRLPSSISASELPDYWICSMNTWDPRSASCAVQEDYKKEDEEHVNNGMGIRENTILGNASGSERTGKLSYKTLITGNGKRPLRPISEKMRWSESIFLPAVWNTSSEEDGPPRPIYADSSVYRGASHSTEKSTNLKGGSYSSSSSMDLFTVLSHSKLWSVLSGQEDASQRKVLGDVVVARENENPSVMGEGVSEPGKDVPPQGDDDAIMDDMDAKKNVLSEETTNIQSTCRCMKISKPWKYGTESITGSGVIL